MTKSYAGLTLKHLFILAVALLATACTSTTQPQLVLSGHTGKVSDVTFSPDGRTVASASWEDGTIRLWNVETGEMLSILQSPKVNRVAFSPDGRIMATSGLNAEVTIWDVETDQQVDTLDAHTPPEFPANYPNPPVLTSLAFSPDGRYLVTIEIGPNANFSADYPISLWETETWNLVKRWEETLGEFAFSPDGSTLIVNTGTQFANNNIIWSLESQEEAGMLEWGGDLYFNYSASGENLVGWRNNGDGVLHFFDPATGKTLSTLPLMGAETGDKEWFLRAVRFTTDGQNLITGDCKNALNLWDASDGRHLAKVQLSPSERWENCLVPIISPDGSLLATLDENRINIWVLPEEFH